MGICVPIGAQWQEKVEKLRLDYKAFFLDFYALIHVASFYLKFPHSAFTNLNNMYSSNSRLNLAASTVF